MGRFLTYIQISKILDFHGSSLFTFQMQTNRGERLVQSQKALTVVENDENIIHCALPLCLFRWGYFCYVSWPCTDKSGFLWLGQQLLFS